MVSPKERIERSARGASGTNSPQLYILGIIYLIFSLLVLYEIIRTIRTIKPIWKNITSRFRILILSSCFWELFLASLFRLISFNWKSIFLILFFYYNIPVWFEFCTFSLYFLYIAKTLQLIEGKQTRIKKHLDLIFSIIIIGNLILIIIVCYFDAENLKDETKYKGIDKVQTLYLLILLLFLILLFIIMGIKYYKKFGDYLLVKIQKERIKYIMILIIIDGLIFITFLIWSIFGAFNANSLSNNSRKSLDNEEYSKYDTFILFDLFFDLTPAFVLFIILHHILSIEKRMFQREENILLADLDDDGFNDNKNEYKLFDIKN
ncbi:integral membrane protein [Anaeramoeba ignava]|uniref:Integral membrane protein n=1 Tax=Anaeramoeba ignava TaxID=1746090 RepID=A0A9Q0LJT0_ANAIG|nr:integral membrane protein [Anaeramoeba ignava]